MLPPTVTARVVVEVASTLGWGGTPATVERSQIGTVGASAPPEQLLNKFAFAPERVAQAARELVSQG
ncbi:hypothetical protein GCM10017744_004220 [Streptomyces antimycoticus]